MQSVIVSNRFILGIVAFSVSFGLSLVPRWDFNQAFFTGLITVVATYAAALFVDRRRRNYELLLLGSLRKHIKEMEGLKSRVVKEIEQLETHRSLLYTESKQLQNQIIDCRSQRDSLHRDLGNCASQKKQLELDASNIKNQILNLEQNQVELNNALSTLISEKRRIESNIYTHRAEITQLQTQINDLQQEKQDIESSLTLLGRIKPQLEEKLYELRIEIQDLEVEKNNQNQSIVDANNEKATIIASLASLQNQSTQQQSELQQIQNEITILQQERDFLQSQVWELLQQTETFNQESTNENLPTDNLDLAQFSNLLENLDTAEDIPETWHHFFQQLPEYEIQVLKAIIEQDNPKAAIKKIAEANITMPNLLIDAINERANDIIGELIIDTDLELPEVYPEYKINVRQIITIYEKLTTRHASSN